MSEQPQYTIRLSDQREFGPAEMGVILQWAREGRVPADALLVPADGSPIRSVLSDSRLASIIQAPPTVSTVMPERLPPADDGASTLIPYRNPPALISYYLGVFSLIPFLGLLPAVPALVLGIVGLVLHAKNPKVKGLVHAWVGIALGGLCTILWAGLIVMLAAVPFGW